MPLYIGTRLGPILPLSGGQKPFPFLQAEWNEVAAKLSPDGRSMAYVSDESGAYEVFVQSFPSKASKKRVSTKGESCRSGEVMGSNCFTMPRDGKLIAVDVRGGTSFERGQPRVLFEFRSGGSFLAPLYTVSADGQRFLLNTIVDESGGAPLTVKVNWQAGLKQ